MLIDTINDFRDHKISTTEADTVVKLTAQITRSLDADLSAQRLLLDSNQPVTRIGDTVLVND